MPHNVDKHAIEEAYVNIRNDITEEIWSLFGYDDNEKIVHLKSGNNYANFLEEFDDSKRLYGFVRLETGDELSRRAKFAFITWIGENVSPLKKAKVSTDKGIVKMIIKNFAIEILSSDKSEFEYETVRTLLDKAGGAHYGTGK